jgi:hypothetical protein
VVKREREEREERERERESYERKETACVVALLPFSHTLFFSIRTSLQNVYYTR